MSVMNEAIREALKIFRPPPTLKISEWANRERYLSSEAAAEPGKYDSSKAQYQVGMMDAPKEPGVEEVVYMTSAQVGKTTVIENVTGYYCENEPSPMLNVQPTLEMAKTFSEERLAPMVRDTPALARVFARPGSRSKGDTILKKKFKGAQITMAGANSAASLASRPVRIVLTDEVDRFPPSAGEEGDPVSLAKKRNTTWIDGKLCVMSSTPVRRGNSRIAAAFAESDQRRYFLPCPGCGFKFVPRFAEAGVDEDFWKDVPTLDLAWDETDPENPYFVCTSCGMVIEHHHKQKMLRAGEWIKMRPAVTKIAGFHLNELYSPWKTWAQVVADFLKVKKNPLLLKTFVNTSLGETYQEGGDAPEWKRLYDRRDEYLSNTVPAGVKVLTCSVDVQAKRLEVEVKGWGDGCESFSICYRKFYGDTSEIETYAPLDEILHERWKDAEGQDIAILKLAIDSGYNSQTVYKWAKKYPRSKVMVIKGSDKLTHTFKTPKENEDWTAVPIWLAGVSVVKREIYGWLKQPIPSDEELASQGYPLGFAHFPKDYPEEYFRGLTSEVEELKTIRGFPQYVWVKTYDRNEALDLFVYNRVAAAVLGVDKSEKSNERLALKSRVEATKDPAKPRKRKVVRTKSGFLD